MSGVQPSRDAARQALAEVVRDLDAWLDWQVALGAEQIPSEVLAPVAPVARELATPAKHARDEGSRQAARAAPPRAERPRETLADVRRDLGECTRCGLHKGRGRIVFGVGSPKAVLVVIGEAPGRDEDRTGEPFVGRSGKLLTRMLAALGLARSDVYICNVLKCRPPRNRDPEPSEIATCSHFLIRQIEAIGPKAIFTVGRFASQVIIGLDETMGRFRGQVRSWRGVPVVCSYHPAYLLHTPAAKAKAWEDLLLLRALLRGTRGPAQE